MNALLSKSGLCALALGWMSLSPALAQEAATPTTAAEQLREDLVLPGITLAEGISEVTGVAISPLLGMSALGAWTYWKTPAGIRPRLPWYCQPFAWGTGLALIGLCFLKDFLSAAAPALVKKPLDFAELFEDKISALVASTAFVPLVALAMTQVDRIQSQTALEGLAVHGVAMMPGAGLVELSVHSPWIAVPAAIVAFLLVWLSSHAINVLIALSPFGLVDAGLKLTKLALITLIAAVSVKFPEAGAVISLLLIAAGALLAGWSFRLTVFGTLMGRDFLLMKRAARDGLDTGVKGFLARRTGRVPVRTFGKLACDPDGKAVFRYRPWLVLPERGVPVAGDGMVLCKGLVHPSVAHRAEADSRPRSTLILLPRYRQLEAEIAKRFGVQEVMDSALMRGFKAIRQWLVDVLSAGRNAVEARA